MFAPSTEAIITRVMNWFKQGSQGKLGGSGLAGNRVILFDGFAGKRRNEAATASGPQN
jgi:hypothetical protein